MGTLGSDVDSSPCPEWPAEAPPRHRREREARVVQRRHGHSGQPRRVLGLRGPHAQWPRGEEAHVEGRGSPGLAAVGDGAGAEAEGRQQVAAAGVVQIRVHSAAGHNRRGEEVAADNPAEPPVLSGVEKGSAARNGNGFGMWSAPRPYLARRSDHYLVCFLRERHTRHGDSCRGITN